MSILKPKNISSSSHDRGVVLLIVIMFLALGTILVTNLAYSTFLQSESVGMLKNRIQSEYILKSLVNYSASILALDQDPNNDCIKEPWAEMFYEGQEIPPDFLGFLGIDESQDVRVAIDIRPLNAKLSIKTLLINPNRKPDDSNCTKCQQLLRLFYILGFDEPEENTKPGSKVYSPEEMLANLVDFLDTDKESANFTLDNKQFTGMEGELREGQEFPNTGSLNSLDELSRIPGFTSRRIGLLSQFITVETAELVNLNLTTPEVIQALSKDITAEDAACIKELTDIRASEEQLEFECNKNMLTEIKEQCDVTTSLSGLAQTNSTRFEVTVRVKYGNLASRFMRAVLKKDPGRNGRFPQLINSVIY